MRRWFNRLQLRVWRRPHDDRDLDDEIRFHLAQEQQLRADRGASPSEAADPPGVISATSLA
jgi:hypothetical protein